MALQMQNNDATLSTRKFITMFNKFFDILNVKSTTIGYHELNKDKMPFEGKADDDRLKVQYFFIHILLHMKKL